MADQQQPRPAPAAPNRNKRDLLNGLISGVLVPEIDKLMKAIAKAIPPDSPLRNQTLLRIADGLLGYVENKTDTMPMVVGTLAEKGINGLELLSALLSGKIEVEKHTPASQNVKTDEIMKMAQDKILKAKTADEVKDILNLLDEQIKAIKKAAKKTQPRKDSKVAATEPVKTLTEIIHKDFTPGVRSLKERIQAAADRRRGGL